MDARSLLSKLSETLGHIKDLNYAERFDTFSIINDTLNDVDADVLADNLHLLLDYDVYVRIAIYSFLLKKTHDGNYCDLILKEALSGELDMYEMHFIHMQLSWNCFNSIHETTKNTDSLLNDLYDNVYEQFNSRISAEIQSEMVPVENRNKGFVVVLCSQLLSLKHSASSAILNQCKVLIKEMNKDVILINDRNQLSVVGFLPLFQLVSANSLDEYDNLEALIYDDIRIPFLQLDKGMPDLKLISGVVNLLLEYRPEYIVSVHPGIMTDICAQFFPILYSGVISKPQYTHAHYQPYRLNITCDDHSDCTDAKKLLAEWNKPDDHFIPYHGSYRLPQQNRSYTHKDFGIPDDRFIGVVVGVRLDQEITDSFLKTLDICTKNSGLYVVFVGKFDDGYPLIRENYPSLFENSSYVGVVDDLSGFYDLCDLYINPLRQGGGVSAFLSMYKGLPVVTYRYGDVYYVAGDEFSLPCGDTEGMVSEILKYINDEEYYKSQSKKGIDMADLWTKSKDTLKDLITEFENRIYK